LIKCTVALSGLNATDDPAPGIAFARCLRESGEWEGRIIGLAYDASETGIYNGSIFDDVYLLPDPLQGSALFNRIKGIQSKNHIDVFVPLLDYELVSLTALEPYLKDIGVSMLIPTAAILRQHLKTRLADFCKRNGIKSPRQTAIVWPDSIGSTIAELGLPVVVKGVIHGSCVAHSAYEAAVYFHQIKQRWGLPIIMQEYISGDEYNTDCLVDRDRKVIGAVSMKKLALTDKGKGWSGVTIYDKGLLDLSFEIVQKLRWVGPIELEFVKQSISGNYYLLEINPRFGTWIYISSKAGQNLPLTAVRIALGERVEPFTSYDTGMMFMRYSLDLVCPISRLGEIITSGELSFTEENSKRTN